MQTSQQYVDSKIKALKEKFNNHLAGYLQNLKEELEAKVSVLHDDYYDSDTGMLLIPQDGLSRAFTTGKHALKDTIEAFWDHEGDSPFDSFETMDDALELLKTDISDHIKDEGTEDHAGIIDGLQYHAEQYRLGSSQYHQDEILKILSNDFNLELIVAPANNQ